MIRIFLFVVAISTFCSGASAMGWVKNKLYQLALSTGQGLQDGFLHSRAPNNSGLGSAQRTVLHDVAPQVSGAAGASGHNAGAAFIIGACTTLNNPVIRAVLEMQSRRIGLSVVQGASDAIPSLFTPKNIGLAAASTSAVVVAGYATLEACKWGHEKIKCSLAQRKKASTHEKAGAT